MIFGKKEKTPSRVEKIPPKEVPDWVVALLSVGAVVLGWYVNVLWGLITAIAALGCATNNRKVRKNALTIPLIVLAAISLVVLIAFFIIVLMAAN
ncbi:MAG: hypothetical protein LBM69_03990 [Lachnospiraceae bacterium]|jgi:hypothetical protein|nr:hypothetical protein [Lachnospiraceae bacterium]